MRLSPEAYFSELALTDQPQPQNAGNLEVTHMLATPPLPQPPQPEQLQPQPQSQPQTPPQIELQPQLQPQPPSPPQNPPPVLTTPQLSQRRERGRTAIAIGKRDLSLSQEESPAEPTSLDAITNPLPSPSSSSGTDFANPSPSNSFVKDTNTQKSPPSTRRSERDAEYDAYLLQARIENFSDLVPLNFLYQSGNWPYPALNCTNKTIGKDPYGRPIVVIIGANLPARSIDLERVMLYAVSNINITTLETHFMVTRYLLWTQLWSLSMYWCMCTPIYHLAINRPLLGLRRCTLFSTESKWFGGVPV